MQVQTIHLVDRVEYAPLMSIVLTVQQLLIVRHSLVVKLDTMDGLDLWDSEEKTHHERTLLLVDLVLAKGSRVLSDQRLLTIPTISMHILSGALREGMAWRHGRRNDVLETAALEVQETMDRLIMAIAA